MKKIKLKIVLSLALAIFSFLVMSTSPVYAGVILTALFTIIALIFAHKAIKNLNRIKLLSGGNYKIY